jgi:hypothetical protein
MKCPVNIPLPCAFHFISSDGDVTQASNFHQATCNQHKSSHVLIFHEWYGPLHSFTMLYWFIDHSLTCSSPLHLVHRHQAFYSRFNASMVHHARVFSSLPFTLATRSFIAKPASWSSPPSHITPCHVSYAMSSFISLVEHLQHAQANSPPWLYVLLTLVYL